MNQSLPLVWGWITTPLELCSFVLAIITVVLNIKQIHWAWLFSILSSALYGLVFFDAKLYGDSGLQVVFILVSVWGWYQWLRHGENQESLAVTRMQTSQRVLAMFAWIVIFVVLYLLLKLATDTDVAIADGFLTAGSLLGQLLLSRKKLENWYVWIVVDVMYVGLYLYKGLMLTALLYAIFVILAIAGARAWRAVCKQEQIS
ncbi:nicotinamide riboside transporter PnuC [Undibacterium baiyunense]|uniref:Nicotinamide riboside transporter PnuC n=1 Tax=Undibacterium baiyunense TaxID=2828731 RepID=A0A941I1P4_9BURK|nr:nicotinamide riboside transporter PnuC [Undibacterium baiyunense]MBR7745447.1 nicotinamide mononucleotide transporter [Undibacterium baiyunense]